MVRLIIARRCLVAPDIKQHRVITVPSCFSVEKIFTKYHHVLIKYLRNHLVNKNEAEDLAQEVYYRVIRNSDNVDVQHPRAYLLKVAKNLLSDHFRYRSRHGIDSQLGIDEIDADLESDAPSPERELLSERELLAVGASLGELSERCQAVFIMHKFEGVSYKDIAHDLGISVHMVEKYMSRAFMHLRERHNRNRNGRGHSEGASS